MQVFLNNSSFSTFSGRAGRVIHSVNRQPSWVKRAAIGAGILVLLSIVAVIVVPVAAVMVAVFAIGTGLARVRRLFRPLREGADVVIIDRRPADDGRRNVRVIAR